MFHFCAHNVLEEVRIWLNFAFTAIPTRDAGVQFKFVAAAVDFHPPEPILAGSPGSSLFIIASNLSKFRLIVAWFGAPCSVSDQHQESCV